MNNKSEGSFRSYVAKPPADIFKLPIGLKLPQGPPGDSLFASSFAALMDVRVPITIATIYAVSVHIANHYRKTNKQPIGFANTRLFKLLVIAHNMALCIYSAWTCIGMSGAIMKSVFEATKLGVAGTGTGKVDDFLTGKSGFLADGSNDNIGGVWKSLCDVNDGIWSSGLSYYGFFFYLSKFYEVFDTMIILAKGRQSSMLQTYHHAGAMLSMWAGIRFASPPIWIFVVFNSLIHTIMYLYYTLSALKIRVPKIIKQSLTTAQICQFIFGGSLASLHLFVYYFDPSKGSFTSCLGDAGQMFALVFNVSYLAPLTYLFVNFWIDSYKKKGGSVAKAVATAKEKEAKKD